ncbi:tRNA lysidine(34) synthetase TilS [Aliishimia ponticola]|uniref:tRNA(Ile)-lysidine synthase n=2 Tax=Aliishimia ponticola TaxID=2499833 RepID=A0A4S4NDC6_9RHOB|nr:tRNA lysidine(34) synthetase TilS [Aliishimia ponticola]
MGQLLGPDFPDHIALAVSGGGDSMAMLALAQNWAHRWGVAFSVVTVDHGLRPESADEARMVGAFCAQIERPHTVLEWRWDGTGNLQDAARRARLDLIDGWRGPIQTVLMAHTSDDVAETFLLRLARGSGVEGLSAMAPMRRAPQGFHILRPCLGMSRAELRHYARVLQVPWADDPSNEDAKYDRSRARALLDRLDVLGLSRDDILATAGRMRRAAVALNARMMSVAEEVVTERAGALLLDRTGFDRVERDTQLRLLAAACMWVSGAEYRPRASGLEGLLDRLTSGGAGTLIGAQIESRANDYVVFREPAAVRDLRAPVGQLWDRRWAVSAPDALAAAQGLEIRALGDAISDCPDWRETGLPRAAIIASPAIWQGAELVCAPLAMAKADWAARIVTPFATWALSH